MKNVLLENIVKNIAIVLVLIFTYLQIQSFFLNTNFDKSVIGSMLVAVSILAVTACFGNFAFTYEKVNLKTGGGKTFSSSNNWTAYAVDWSVFGNDLGIIKIISRKLFY